MPFQWTTLLERSWQRDLLLAVLVYCMLIFKSWEYRFNYEGGMPEYLFENAITWCVILSLIYLNHYVWLPHFFERKRYALYVFLVIASILGVSYLQNLHCGCNAVKAKFFYYFLTTGIGMAALFYRRYWKHEQHLQQKELLQQKMELKYLKAQINPHFLFNALNSVYVLTRQHASNASEVVLQLSQLLRYQLESSTTQWTALVDELHFIENYLLLEELRLGERCRIEFEIVGDVKGKEIAPLLLIVFVENAFKHGANASRGKSFVEVKAEIEAQNFRFTVRNSYAGTLKNSDSTTPKLGLENVKRRLQLLYPSHHLKIERQAEVYQIGLTMSLVRTPQNNTI